MQTQRTSCSKAEPKIFTPPQTLFPGVQDGQNLTSWRWSLPSLTNPVWWRLMHAISSYRGNRPTNPQTNTQDWLQYTASLTFAYSVKINKYTICTSCHFLFYRFKQYIHLVSSLLLIIFLSHLVSSLLLQLQIIETQLTIYSPSSLSTSQLLMLRCYHSHHHTSLINYHFINFTNSIFSIFSITNVIFSNSNRLL